MNSSQVKELCIALMKVDSEEEVVRLLKEAGFWEDHSAWRFYGDSENNYSTIGNQQSRPDAALVEKLVNSVDARLMNECLVRGIDPEGPDAPSSVTQAVFRFFEDSSTRISPYAGQIENWPDEKRTQIARSITLVATGVGAKSGNPCFTVSDCGEGQTPEKLPDTILSLDRKNKQRIPFVQGRFNMGGTGVFKFCGRHNLQLVVSRRNPAILNGRLEHPSDAQWGFTVVRREDPEGGRRSSVYTYLAPNGGAENPGKGGVLCFTSDGLTIFPEGRDPYARESEWGTLIKLYEYAATGFKSHILMKDGLLSRMDLLLPGVALPIRFHECRPGYRGHAGSFETTLTGLGVRLEDDRGNNLEEGFPSSCPLSALGEQMTATIYTFKKGKAETYRKNEGIIFTLNGQTHGHLTPDFYRRKNVGLSYLAESILVVVDCTCFSGRAREDLIMNSRDRLSGGDLRIELEHALEDMLRHHQGLRDLKERRRREETEAKLADSKPLEEILESVLKKSPALASLFLDGTRVSNPFKSIKVRSEEKPFEGNRYPTFFKHKGKDYGTVLIRETHINMRSRITFETDAVNDYFSRSADRGEFSLFLVNGGHPTPVASYVGPNLQNGIATLSVQLPVNCRVGDELDFVAIVTDPSRVEAFENRFTVRVKPAAEPRGKAGERRKPPTHEEGEDRELSRGISLPNIVKVHEAEWERYSPAFDKYTALRIRHAGSTAENGENAEEKSVYDFFVNMDNVYLKSEMKRTGCDPDVFRARFIYGLVLVGLALLQEEQMAKDKNKDDEAEDAMETANIEDRVEQFTRAVAPVLLPMIESLGALDDEAAVTIDASGEAM